MNDHVTDLEQLLSRGRARRRLPASSVRRWLRQGAGLSQAEIAAHLGVERATVSRWESGARTPRGARLERYVALLERLATRDAP